MAMGGTLARWIDQGHTTQLVGTGSAAAPTLVIVPPGEAPSHAPLPTRGRVTIGRDPGCDVVIDHPSISRRHGVLEVGERLTYQDLGGKNGSSIAGRAIAPSSTIEVLPGEALVLGQVTLLIQGRRAAAAGPAGPGARAVVA